MRRERSKQTAERFLQLYEARNKLPPRALYRRKAFEARQSDQRLKDAIDRWRERPVRPSYRRVETALLREIVFEHVTRFPRSAMEIYREVADDFGSHTERRFWRALRYLIITGRIKRTEDGYRRISARRVGGRAC